MKKGFYVFLIATILFWGCGGGSKNRSSNNLDYKASLRLNWIPASSSVGEIVGMKNFAKNNSLDLKIEVGGAGLDPIKLIEADVNTFGVVGADLVLSANDKGGDYVIIGLVSYDSPGVFLSKAEKNIKTIADIKPSTRIGELSGGNMIYLYEIFLKKAGLIRNVNFKPVSIPFEIKNFISSDNCDILPVFIYGQPSELDLLNIKYNIIEPRSLGISFKGLCYFCKRKTVNENPKLVQAFINTMIDGWYASIENPESAIKDLKEFDSSIQEDKELLGLKRGLEYFKGYKGKLLYTDTESWLEMINDMKELGFLKNEVDINNVLNMSFIENYYVNR